MDTAEIPRDRWTRFFDDFSALHAGWIVRLEVIGPTLGAQEEVSSLPLVGLAADVKGRTRVEVIVGGTPGAHMTRIIESPRRVWVRPPETIGRDVIDIESDDWTVTLLHFDRGRPVDRLLPSEAR